MSTLAEAPFGASGKPIPAAQPRRRYAIASLATASFVDSSEDNAMSILWPYIHRSLGVSVGQLGPILGISKAILTLSLPLWGYAADRFSRRNLLAWVTGFWGIWTLVLAFVDSVPQLIVVRAISSLGLGVFMPAAFSLISDLFPDNRRGRATGSMTAVGLIGTITAFAVLPALAESDPEAWRNGFMVLGIASVITGVLLLQIKEPERGATEPELANSQRSALTNSYRISGSDISDLVSIPSWWLMTLSEVLRAAGLGVFSGWAFTWLEGLGLGGSAAIVVGLMALGSIVGAASFGWIGDRLSVRYPKSGRIGMAMAGQMIAIPSIILLLMVNPEHVGLLVLFGFVFGAAQALTGDGVSWPLLQSVLRPEIRATGRAVSAMATGGVAAIALVISGRIADEVGVAQMLLYVTPVPAILGTLVWSRLFVTYGPDCDALRLSLAADAAATGRVDGPEPGLRELFER